MAQKIHNISNPNDGLGDPLRTAFDNQNEMNTELYAIKVDKVTGQRLTENNFSDADKAKLDGLTNSTQVQSDWAQDDFDAVDYIKNKDNVELISNKISEITGYSETLYPNEKAVKDAIDLKANDSNVVHLDGDEVIIGMKSFEGGVNVQNLNIFDFGNIDQSEDGYGAIYLTQHGLAVLKPVLSSETERHSMLAQSGDQLNIYCCDTNRREIYICLSSALLTSWQDYFFPNKSGTIALISDLDDILNPLIIAGTKTKITYDEKGLVTSGEDATTIDIADSADKRYVTDADLVKLSNTSGINTGDQDLSGKADLVGGLVQTSQLPIANLTTSGIVNLVDQNLGKGKKIITANVGDVNISDFVDSNGVVVVGVGNTNRIIKLTDNQTIQAVRIGVLATNDTTTPRTLRIVASGGVDEPSGNLVFEIPSSYAVLGNSGKMKFIAGKNYAWGEYSTIEFITKTTGGVETTVFLIDNIGVPTSNNGLKVISVATTGIGQSITANSITTGSGLDVTTASAAINSTNGFFRVFNNAVVSTPTGLFARIQPNSTSGSGLTVINNGSVGIGTTAPVATAQLQIDSTTKGVLIPRMTLVQRNAIVTPVTSLLIFCTDSVAGGEFEYYNGTTWSSLAGSFNGRVDLNGQITPTILGADTNNYNPIGLASANLINLSSSLNISLTGLIAPSPIGGQMIVLYNNGTNNILIKANSLLSSVGNRFVINADINLQSGESVTIVFNINKNGWIVSGKLI